MRVWGRWRKTECEAFFESFQRTSSKARCKDWREFQGEGPSTDCIADIQFRKQLASLHGSLRCSRAGPSVTRRRNAGFAEWQAVSGHVHPKIVRISTVFGIVPDLPSQDIILSYEMRPAWYKKIFTPPHSRCVDRDASRHLRQTKERPSNASRPHSSRTGGRAKVKISPKISAGIRRTGDKIARRARSCPRSPSSCVSSWVICTFREIRSCRIDADSTAFGGSLLVNSRKKSSGCSMNGESC